MTRTRLASAVLLSACVAVVARAEPGAELTDAASAWWSGLTESQQDEARYAFDDEERFDLRLAPLFLEGLRRDALTDAQ